MSDPENERKPEIKENSPKAELIFISGEVPTPPAMFEYFLQQRLGRICDSPEVIPVLTTTSGVDQAGVLLSLPPQANLEHWWEQIEKITGRERLGRERQRVLGRLANYCNHCQIQAEGRLPLERLRKQRASPYLYQRLVEICLRHFGQPARALEASQQLFAHFEEYEIDPFTYQNAEPPDLKILREIAFTEAQNELNAYRQMANGGSTTSFEIPILHQESAGQLISAGETRVEEILRLIRPLGRLRVLEGLGRNKVSITIAGPANSGKSTLTASLTVKINELISQAMSSVDLADLQLHCHPIDLDACTPDIERILRESGFGDRPKRVWTPTLALATAREFLRQEREIIIGDAPGGDPDDITTTVISPSDLTILLVAADTDQEWRDRHHRWQDALKKMGRPPVVLLRSRRQGERSPVTGDELESMVTSFRWHDGSYPFDLPFSGSHDLVDRVGGRIVGLNRKVKDNDPGIDLLAKLLLFDLLPMVVIRRKAQTLRMLTELRREAQLE